MKSYLYEHSQTVRLPYTSSKSTHVIRVWSPSSASTKVIGLVSLKYNMKKFCLAPQLKSCPTGSVLVNTHYPPTHCLFLHKIFTFHTIFPTHFLNTQLVCSKKQCDPPTLSSMCVHFRKPTTHLKRTSNMWTVPNFLIWGKVWIFGVVPRRRKSDSYMRPGFGTLKKFAHACEITKNSRTFFEGGGRQCPL